MNALFQAVIQPGTRLMQNLRLPAKFALISVAFLVPLSIAMYGVVDYAGDNIGFAERERSGAAYVAPMNKLMQQLLRPHAASASRRGGEDALADLERLDREQDGTLEIASDLSELRSAWSAGKTDDAISQSLLLYSVVSDNSKLTLDPDIDSYYAMAIVMDYAPKLAAAAAQLDALTANVRSHGAITPDDKAAAQFVMARVSTYYDSLSTAVRRAIAANPPLAVSRCCAETLRPSNRSRGTLLKISLGQRSASRRPRRRRSTACWSRASTTSRATAMPCC
jgi:methyl-accepting chemotaxis protein